MKNKKIIFVFEQGTTYCKVTDERCRPVGCPLCKDGRCKWMIHREDMQHESK